MADTSSDPGCRKPFEHTAGSELTIAPAEMVAGGEALARVDGFPIFVSNVFPGDVALVRLVEVKKGFARAQLVRIINPSPSRRVEPCPVAEECGGCDWTALRLDKQLEAKQRILIESLRRTGKFDVADLPPVKVHASPLNYRIRSRLHHDGGAVGFYAMRSNRVVQLPRECEVVGTATARAFGSAGRSASGRKTRETSDDIEPDVADSAAADVEETHDGTASIVEPGDDIWDLGAEPIEGDREIIIRIDNYTWRVSTRAFFQVNRHLLSTMLKLVTSHAARMKARHRAIDLYAGAGFFTMPLSRMFHRVVAVEGSPVSARYARLNAERNVEVIEAPVERAVRSLKPADFLFLDPPRAGARPEVITAAAEKTKEMICYLSCDPVTFARDANRLSASGWRLSTLDLLDLFPNTHHVESLSSFERAR